MPLFEYKCKKCSKEFEELVRSSDEKVKCPACQSADVEKKMSVFAHKSGEKFRPSTSASACSSCTASSCSTCTKG